MVTLKEAVESGRRWRYNGGVEAVTRWFGGDTERFDDSWRWTTAEATSSDFEIEPEPEKPREWIVHVERGYLQPCIKTISDPCPTGQPPLRVHDADACDEITSVIRRKADAYDHGATATNKITGWGVPK